MNTEPEGTCIGCGQMLAPEYPYLCLKCQEEERRKEEWADESDRDYL